MAVCAGGKPVWDHATSTSNYYWLIRAPAQRKVRSGDIVCSPGVEAAVTRLQVAVAVYNKGGMCVINSINASESLHIPVKRCLLLCQPLDIMSYLAMERF